MIQLVVPVPARSERACGDVVVDPYIENAEARFRDPGSTAENT